jgi:hypothetical protein
MNEYSTHIYNQIIEVFPDLKDQNKQDTDLLEFHIQNEYNAELGDIYVQTSENDEIWIRATHPFSTYQVDAVEELIYIIEGLIYNELFWVISYEEDDWDDTFLMLKDQEIKTEEGFTYKILSWNGKDDKVIKA